MSDKLHELLHLFICVQQRLEIYEIGSDSGYDVALCDFLLAHMSDWNLGLYVGPKHFVLESKEAVTQRKCKRLHTIQNSG